MLAQLHLVLKNYRLFVVTTFMCILCEFPDNFSHKKRKTTPSFLPTELKIRYVQSSLQEEGSESLNDFLSAHEHCPHFIFGRKITMENTISLSRAETQALLECQNKGGSYKGILQKAISVSQCKDNSAEVKKIVFSSRYGVIRIRISANCGYDDFHHIVHSGFKKQLRETLRQNTNIKL